MSDVTKIVQVYLPPDIAQQAIERIAELEAEVARLREALAKILPEVYTVGHATKTRDAMIAEDYIERTIKLALNPPPTDYPAK